MTLAQWICLGFGLYFFSQFGLILAIKLSNRTMYYGFPRVGWVVIISGASLGMLGAFYG